LYCNSCHSLNNCLREINEMKNWSMNLQRDELKMNEVRGAVDLLCF